MWADKNIKVVLATSEHGTWDSTHQTFEAFDVFSWLEEPKTDKNAKNRDDSIFESIFSIVFKEKQGYNDPIGKMYVLC